MSPTTWVVLPLKERHRAKSRLARAIDGLARVRLAYALAAHSLAVLSEVAGIGVVVITRDPAFTALAARYHFAALTEAGEGHSEAARQAAMWAADQGARLVLALAGDLPLLRADDVCQLLAAGGGDRAVLAPDHSGLGTNAILAPPVFPYSFGAPSLARHRALALGAGLQVVVVRTYGLAVDLDDPADLERLRRTRPTPMLLDHVPDGPRPGPQGW